MNTQFLNKIVGILSPRIQDWRIETYTSNETGYSFCANVGFFAGLVMTMETNVRNHICLTFLTVDELRIKNKEELNDLAVKRTMIIKDRDLVSNLHTIGYGERAPEETTLPVCAR